MIRLRYQARVGVWWRWLRGWTGPFATAEGACRFDLGEIFTPEQRAAWRTRR